MFTKIAINRWLRTTTNAQSPELFENKIREALIYDANPVGGCARRLDLKDQIIQEREQAIHELQLANQQLQQQLIELKALVSDRIDTLIIT